MPTHRFHEVDLLRGFACVAVVAFHYLHRGQAAGWISSHAPAAIESVARYGYLGVHLFFIISGFVIFMSAQGASVRSFAASRAARLYPALWIAAPVTATMAWAFQRAEFQVQISQLLVNLTMFPHWLKVDFVDGAYWTLAVELQFYLLIALAIALRGMDRAEWWVAAWLGVSAVNAVRPMYPLEFWLAAKWAPLFSAGICFYLLRFRGRSAVRLALLGVSYLLALKYEIGSLAQPPSGSAPDWVSASVRAGAISAFYALFFWIAGNHRQFKPTPIRVWAGLLTYPVYLLHQNVGYEVLEALRPLGLPFALRVPLTVATVGFMAWTIVVLVEKPLAPRIKRLINPTAAPRGQSSRHDLRRDPAP